MHYDNIENNGMKKTKFLKTNLCMTGVHTQLIALGMDVYEPLDTTEWDKPINVDTKYVV